MPGDVVDGSKITGWHAHVYFDGDSRDAAWQLRETIKQHIGDKVAIGHFHERPVGPHPKWTYQLYIEPANFTSVVEWLVLNHGSLDILLHPITGDDLRDHKVSATWIGRSHDLILDNL